MPSNEHTQRDVFDVQAEVGMTKHLGGLEATKALVSHCRIGADSYVLDAGCGAGATTVWLARALGCRVVGLDLREGMVERTRERAQSEGLAHRVTARQGDILDLPFEDATFDAVIVESVTVFPDDKRRAMNEYVRVCKPGGCVGLSEATWMQPTPQRLVDFMRSPVGGGATLLDAEGWSALLTEAGLELLLAEPFDASQRSRRDDIRGRYRLRDVWRAWGRTFRAIFRDPDYRAYLAAAKQAPRDLMQYMGYGLYVGKKAEA